MFRRRRQQQNPESIDLDSSDPAEFHRWVVETAQQRFETKLATQTGNASYIDCLVMAAADHYQTRIIFGFDDTFRGNGYVLPADTLNEDAA